MPVSKEKWINEIDIDYQGNNDPILYTIGSTFENIFYDIKSTFSLKDFFDKIEKFFNKQMHMIYQQEEPKNKKIMEWYAVEPDSNPTTDETIAANNGEN